MKKKLRKYIILPLLAVLWLCGCGKKEETDKAEAVPDTAAETESQTEETEEKEQERTQKRGDRYRDDLCRQGEEPGTCGFPDCLLSDTGGILCGDALLL